MNYKKMSDLDIIKECDENIREANKSSFIRHCDTIAQYKIMEWVNEKFFNGSVFLEFVDSNKAVITDIDGDKMQLAYENDKGVYEYGTEK